MAQDARRPGSTVCAVDGDDRRAELTVERLAEDSMEVDSVDVRRETANVALLAYGWWRRCVRTADAIRILHREGLGHEAAPLTRTLLHHTAALCWLRLEPSVAYDAVLYDHDRSRFKLGQSVIMLDWDVDPEAVRVKKPSGPRPAGVDYLDNVDKLVKRVGLPDIYVAFRTDSSFVHPSAIGADVYLERTPPSEEIAVALRHEPDAGPSPMRTVASSAIQATLCLAELSGDGRIAALAAEANERFGVEINLPQLPT
jgi:hypothetical protein